MDHMNDEGYINPFPPKPARNQAPTTRLVPTARGRAAVWIITYTGLGLVLGFAAATIIVVVTTW